MVDEKQKTIYQVKFIVDANIVFSGILNTNGKIADLLINSEEYFDFIAPDFLRSEIHKHYHRLAKISGLTVRQIQESEFFLYRNITFISPEQIPTQTWIDSEKLVFDVDPNDVQYVAYSKHFKAKLWSGDKQLMNGLRKKGFNNFITTNELFKLRETLK